jgi:hypothetical protein
MCFSSYGMARALRGVQERKVTTRTMHSVSFTRIDFAVPTVRQNHINRARTAGAAAKTRLRDDRECRSPDGEPLNREM